MRSNVAAVQQRDLADFAAMTSCENPLLQLLTWLHVPYYHDFWNNKDGSLLIPILALFNCFTYRNLFQNGSNNMSKMVNMLRDGFKTQPPVDRRFRPVSFVLNNDNHPEPEGTAGQPRLGFEVALSDFLSKSFKFCSFRTIQCCSNFMVRIYI